jgi:hypothetical protein
LNLSIHYFKTLILPSFWWNAFSLAIKEHWIYLVFFSLSFNGSSLLRGEIIEFTTSVALASLVVGILFTLYVVFYFTIKSFKDASFRVMLLNKPCIEVARELLRIKVEQPQITEFTSLSEDLPDTTSKIGFAFIIGMSIVTILGILYVWYLIANQ